MENLKPRILVTGGGAPGAYGIIHSLQQDYEVFSCDIQQETIGSSMASHSFTVPAGNDADYIPALLDRCKAYKIELVFPITTKELIPLSKAKAEFESEGIKVLISPTSELEIANDKGALYRHLHGRGVQIPEFKLAYDLDSFEQASKHWLDRGLPFVFKPCVSNGSRGFRIINAAVDAHDLLFNEKPNNANMSYVAALSTLSSKAFPELLVSDYLSGAEYTVDCLVDNGQPLLILPRLRTKMNNGISVAGELVEHKEIIAYCKSILAQLNLHGPIGIQVKMNDRKEARLLEINPRIQGSSVALNGAAVPLISLAVRLGLGESIAEAIDDLKIGWGIRFQRHYQEIYWKS